MSKKPKKREIIEAESLNIGPCDFCPAIHINFLDRVGNLLATGSLPIESVDAFIERIRKVKGELALRHSAPAREQ